MISDEGKAERFDEVIYHADELILGVEKFLSGYRITLQREIYSKYEFYDDEGGYQAETDFIESDFSDYSCEDIYICCDLLGEGDYLKSIPEYQTILLIGGLAHAVKSWYLAKQEGNLVEMMFLSTFMYFSMGKIKNTLEIEVQFAKKFKSDFAKSNAAKRLAKDPKQKSMLQIEKAYKEKWDDGFRFPQGRLKEFYEGMAIKHGLDFNSVKNRVENIRRELGHTNIKKQSS